MRAFTAAVAMILFSGPAFGAGTGLPAAPSHRDTVTVDFVMAERMVEWLEAAAAGASEEALRGLFFEKVAPTGGCQAIIKHWARFRDWDEELFFNFILEALGRVPVDAPLEDEHGQPTRLGWAHPLWQAAIENPQRVRRDIAALREANVQDRAVAAARRFLPDDAVATNEFFVVLFGASPAFSIGEQNGYDILQLPRLANGALDTERIIATFAHEIHHSGFTSASRAAMGPLASNRSLSFVGMLVAEGMATTYLTPSFLELDHLRQSPNQADRAISADWDFHLPRLPELFSRAEAMIESSLDSPPPIERLVTDWLAGAAGPVYVLGVEMIRTIDRELGLEAVLELVDFRRLLLIYNKAAQRAVERGDTAYVFDHDLAKRLAWFGEDTAGPAIAAAGSETNRSPR